MRSIEFRGRELVAIDSTKLPATETRIRLRSAREVASAIKDMRIRGAPLIGVAAAYGLALDALGYRGRDISALRAKVLSGADLLRHARPTGRNLGWALERCISGLDRAQAIDEAKRMLLCEANQIADEDAEVNLRIATMGQKVIEDRDVVLTHCNTGGLGTTEYGTALGIIRLAWESGKKLLVLATETRPLLQGARLTAWELKKYRVPFRLICDSMAGYVMSRGMVNKVLVGADRILATGHVANKVGTLTLGVLARYYGVPFYVAAPLSTFDLITKPSAMPIEQRDPREITHLAGKLITVRGIDVMNPAFDVTPPELVTSIITEKAVIHPPYPQSIANVFAVRA